MHLTLQIWLIFFLFGFFWPFFGAIVAPIWPSWTLLGSLLAFFWRYFWLLGPLMASPGSLLVLFWGFLEDLEACPGAFLEDDRSWITFWAISSHLPDSKSDPKIVVFFTIYGSLFCIPLLASTFV